MSLLSEIQATDPVRPLVVTPLPDPREAAIGYALRLCDANSYDSPTMFLGGIGLDLTRQALGGTASILSALTVKDESMYGRIAIRKAEDHSYYLKEQRLSGRHVSFHHHKICPICIHADGIHDASWHLSLITHCPVHRAPLVNECLRCGAGYRMNRPATDRCKCGSPVSEHPSAPPCSIEAATLFATMRAKLLNDTCIAIAPRELSAFEGASLNEFLNLITAMHKFVVQHCRGLGGDKLLTREQRAMHVVATALLQLEQGVDVFHGTLRGRPVAPDEYVPAAAFRWFKVHHAGLIRTAGLSFLAGRIDAFLAGRRVFRPKSEAQRGPRSPEAVLRRDEALRGSEAFDRKWVLADKAGSLTECDDDYVRWAARLKLFTWAKGIGNRMVVAREEILRLRLSASIGLQPEEASALADIPVQLFNRLARSRIHVAQFIPSTGGPHSKEDVLRLKGSINDARHVVIEGLGQTVQQFLNRTPKSMLNSTKPLVETMAKHRRSTQ
jgi:hypothetical protein